MRDWKGEWYMFIKVRGKSECCVARGIVKGQSDEWPIKHHFMKNIPYPYKFPTKLHSP
jgi:hypothetical protein